MAADVISIEEGETSIKTWLEEISFLLVIQPGDNPVIKTPHIMFQMVGASMPEYSNIEFSADESGQAQKTVVTETDLTYQIDAMYCTDSVARIAKVLKYFESGLYRLISEHNNFAFADTVSDIRRLVEWRSNRRHYRASVDVVFRYRSMEYLPINNILEVNIGVCGEASATLPIVSAIKP